MKNRMKKLLAMAATASMILGLTACGGGSSSSGSSAAADAGSSSAAQAASTTAAAATSAADTAASGVNNDADGNGRADKVVYASTQAYTSLTPFLNPKTYTAAVFESLGSYTTFGTDYQGLLMESYEKTDDLTYRVKIYDNIYDSAGNHITADDVVFSYNEVRNGGEMASKVSVIDSVTKVDDYTVDMKWINTPYAGAFENITSFVNIVSEKAYEDSGDGMASKPVGTGPYVVDSWTSGVDMVLKVNDNYWASGDQVKFKRQEQNVDEIDIQTISETSQLTMALQTGSIDMTEDVSSQDVANFEDGGAYADNYDVDQEPDYAPKSLLINVDPASPTSDENLRQALMRVIDNDSIAAIVNGGANQAVYGLGSPLNSDYDEAAFKSYIPERSTEEAKKYLDQSAYANGVTLKLLLIDGGIDNDIAEIIQNQCAQIGITVEVEAETFPNWLSDKDDPTKWDMILSQLSSTDYCTSLWVSAFDLTGKEHNDIFSTDQTLLDLLAACDTDETHTQESVDAFQQYLTEQAYVVPLLVQLDYNVYDSTLISEIAYSGEGAVIPQGFTYK